MVLEAEFVDDVGQPWSNEDLGFMEGWSATIRGSTEGDYLFHLTAGATMCDCHDHEHRGPNGTYEVAQCKHAWHFKVRYLKIPQDSYLAYQTAYLPWEWCVKRALRAHMPFLLLRARLHTPHLQALHQDAARCRRCRTRTRTRGGAARHLRRLPHLPRRL